MQQNLPDHIQKTVNDFRRRLERNAEERRELSAGLEAVLKLAQSQSSLTTLLPDQPIAEDLADCPLSIEEMTQLSDRHRIIKAIAARDPAGRVHVGQAAKWLHASRLVSTIPVNLSKALSRRMRREPAIWEYQGDGWFRLRDHPGPDPYEDQMGEKI